ncbi:DEBR0S1_30702g1_1 [Brettanomyces bruxellensis]|uniref:DNA replication complex GINS protein PSF2 n=1 Tax=Dekkera bruxellensis TaxID=5007 RepID=A0A7D9CXH9_DEKBR|nr:DEBR0S1_30702g1_1 [Brettanomyces bruxellensis]
MTSFKFPSFGFTTNEISFLAEQETITILPRYTMNGTRLIGAKMQNLRAMQRQDVPIWLALILKSQDKCNVVIPDWLTVNYLKQRYDEEVKEPNKFSELPWHWLPISKILLDKCSDDFLDHLYEIRSVLQDLREVRQLKARKGIKELNGVYLQLDGLSLMEINEIRPFIIESMNKLRLLSQSVRTDQLAGVGEDEAQQSVQGKGNAIDSEISYDDSQIYRTTNEDSNSKPSSSRFDRTTTAGNESGIYSSANTTRIGATDDRMDDADESEDSDIEYRIH